MTMSKVLNVVLKTCWIVLGLPIALVWAMMALALDPHESKSTLIGWWKIAVGR